MTDLARERSGGSPTPARPTASVVERCPVAARRRRAARGRTGAGPPAERISHRLVGARRRSCRRLPVAGVAPAGGTASLVTPIATASSTATTPRQRDRAVAGRFGDARDADDAGAAGAGRRRCLPADAVARRRVRHRAALAAALPLSVGRSRHQTLVVDRSHRTSRAITSTSSRSTTPGATVVLHGDNGVLVEGVPTPPAARSAGRPARRSCSRHRAGARAAPWRSTRRRETEMPCRRSRP